MRRRLFVGLVYAMLLMGVVGADTMYVKVKQASLKEKPRGFSKELAKLPEGAAVDVSEASGAYLRARTGAGQDGWVHETSVQEVQRRRVTGTGTGGAHSSEEVAAATKGWSEEVERAHRARRGTLEQAYREVDAMERRPSYPRPFAQLEGFRREGRLGEFQP